MTKKIWELPELASISDDDLFLVANAPAGTPTTRYITAANLNYASKSAANVFTAGPQQVTIDSAGNKGFVIKAANSQTANLQEWQNSSGTALVTVDADGWANFGHTKGIRCPGGSQLQILEGSGGGTGSINISASTVGLASTFYVNNRRTVNITAAPVTVSGYPFLSITGTWNAGGVTHNGIKLNVTDTSSATNSTLLDLQVASSSKFSVHKTGAIIPVSLADSAAPNSSIYYSTDASKLVFKDSGGVVNNLY